MITKETDLGLGWRHNVKQLVLCSSSIVLCAGLCSCTSVIYDMRRLEQPVTMNGNPFVCKAAMRPTLESVDGYSSHVHDSVLLSSSGPNQSKTTSMKANYVQARAFEKIGGDPSLTITDIRLNTESMGVNLLFAMGSQVTIFATGTVQKVHMPIQGKREVKK